MTTFTDDIENPEALAAENARLRLAIAHLAVYSRAVLECRDTGAITLAHQGYPGYQASHALAALEECTTRALAGDWKPLTQAQIASVWDRYARRPLWGEEYLTCDRWLAAINDLLWHPDRKTPVPSAPTLPVDGTVGFADEAAGAYGFAPHK